MGTSKTKTIKLLKRLSMVSGAKGGCEIRFGGNQAYHVAPSSGNRGVINFPLGDFTDPDYLMLINGLSDHENGHARFTKAVSEYEYSALKKQSVQFINSFRNLFEDIRMELKMINEFEGCRSNLSGLVDMAIKRGLFSQPQSMGVQGLSSYYLYGLRVDVLHQTQLTKWADEARTMMLKDFADISHELETIYERAKFTQSNHECFELAKELYEIIAEESEDDSDSSDSSDSDDSASSQQSQQTPTSSQHSAKSALEDDDGLYQDIHELLNEAIEEMAEEYQGNGGSSELLNIGYETGLVDGLVDASAAARLQRPVKTSLIKELMKQNRVERSYAERGRRLMGQRLAGVHAGQKEVFITERQHKAPNAAVSIVVDSSGSMCPNFDNSGSMINHPMLEANNIALAMAKALELVKGAQCEVAYYPESDGIYIAKPWEIKSQPNRFAVQASYSTPTGEAMHPLITRLACRPEPKKIMFVITDGSPDSSRSVESSIQYAHEMNIKVYGIGICGANNLYGFEEAEFVVVDDLSQLHIKLRDLLKK